MNTKNYVPKEQRKKILLISDDIRSHSGVGGVAREIILNASNHFNFIVVGGAVRHPEEGKRLDLCEDTNKLTGLNDSEVIMYPVSGYGSPDLIRYLLSAEKPDAIFLITDPRYYSWLFQIENEVRKQVPIVYLNIWDDGPAPHYNLAYYESCDMLLGISKQTKNLNRLVLKQGNVPYMDLDEVTEVIDNIQDKTRKIRNTPVLLKYIPHGLDHRNFHPLNELEKSSEYDQFKKQILGNKDYDFVLLFNSRNIRRKQIPDTLLAYKFFIDQLPPEKAEKCCFLLHTQVCDDNGTDLEAVREFIFGEDKKYNIIFSDQVLNSIHMNYLYNLSDAQILLTSNEGWGLSLTEAILAGKVIIANVTGGMQDQMKFGKGDDWVDFDADFISNHNGTIKECGDWAFPVFPSNKSLVGSPVTPYIWDDRCTPEDACEQIINVYNLSKEEREKRGLKGREWAIKDEVGFTSEIQADRIIDSINTLFKLWKPRDQFEFVKINDVPLRSVNHKLQY